MIYRDAIAADIKGIQIVRNAVTENPLSNPDLITDEDCLEFITKKGNGWICEIDSKVVGFSIVDLDNNNIWALFISPEFEKRGIGRQLHDMMLGWYFKQTKSTVWLGTSPKTRAETFYRKAGWTEVGIHGDGEVKFEMTYKDWEKYGG
ncbi:MAG: GNAT superfamily N-acetyltransferase [Saprospiraceae bacterium]|jgi:GNAT superfamily N-acetyltransferase